MLLSDCLGVLSVSCETCKDFLNEEISLITDNSRAVQKNCVFVCIKGRNFDGHSVAKQAIDMGAAIVVGEYDLNLPRYVRVSDSPAALSLLSQAANGFPAKSMKLLGVTGTNGKTTITFMIKGMLDTLGKNAGLIGTVRNELGSLTIPSKFTTPAPNELSELFSAMRANSIESVAMEVSSQALSQGRVAGLEFEVGIFTNLTQDHLDYHGSMEKYFEAKSILAGQCAKLLVNIDDSWGKRLFDMYAEKSVTFSEKDSSADFYAFDTKATSVGMEYKMRHKGREYTVCVPVFGGFSVMNSMQAIAALSYVGVSVEAAVEAIAKFKGVPGRTELLYADKDFKIIRDYAHSPDAIENVMHDFKEYVSPKRLVALFGCAGNRDRTKRIDMARAAAKYSDFVVLTSDNPRDESELQIIDDTTPGLVESGVEYVTIPDRYTAILWAISNRKQGDLLVLLGKGHEDYQVLKDGTIYFDEAVIVDELMQQEKNGGLLGKP